MKALQICSIDLPFFKREGSNLHGHAETDGLTLRVRIVAVSENIPDGGFTMYAQVAWQMDALAVLSLIAGMNVHCRTQDAASALLQGPVPRTCLLYKPPEDSFGTRT